MTVVWDATRAVDVPGIIDGFRGTCLNFKAKADVIHPITLIYKSLADFQFQTDHILADIRGGEELPGADKNNPLLSLGEYAYFDETGQLRIGNELDDLESYRALAMPEIQPASTGFMGGMEGAEGGMEMGMPGGPGAEMGEMRGGRNRGGKKKGSEK